MEWFTNSTSTVERARKFVGVNWMPDKLTGYMDEVPVSFHFGESYGTDTVSI